MTPTSRPNRSLKSIAFFTHARLRVLENAWVETYLKPALKAQQAAAAPATEPQDNTSLICHTLTVITIICLLVFAALLFKLQYPSTVCIALQVVGLCK